MAGTDRRRSARSPTASPPAIVLVEPQLGENIGMAARAMLNCGLADLRLVGPRDGWPSKAARAAAAGADAVLEGARLFDSAAAAIADLELVYATTARPRDMTKPVATPHAAAVSMRAFAAGGGRAGVLFGKESKGLRNDDVALANAILTVPLNPGFSSLNLAQAVFVVGYEWFQAADATPGETLEMPKTTRPATVAELLGLYGQLERALDDCGFLRVAEKRPTMVRNLRNLFGRAHLTEQEVKTLRGIVTCLTRRPGGGR